MATRVKVRRTQAERPFGFGTLSLAAFVFATGVLLAEAIFCLWAHVSGASPDVKVAADTACVVWMIRITPIYILGVWLGLVGVRGATYPESARLGVWINGVALFPANLFPLLSYCFRWVKF